MENTVQRSANRKAQIENAKKRAQDSIKEDVFNTALEKFLHEKKVAAEKTTALKKLSDILEKDTESILESRSAELTANTDFKYVPKRTEAKFVLDKSNGLTITLSIDDKLTEKSDITKHINVLVQSENSNIFFNSSIAQSTLYNIYSYLKSTGDKDINKRTERIQYVENNVSTFLSNLMSLDTESLKSEILEVRQKYAADVAEIHKEMPPENKLKTSVLAESIVRDIRRNLLGKTIKLRQVSKDEMNKINERYGKLYAAVFSDVDANPEPEFAANISEEDWDKLKNTDKILPLSVVDHRLVPTTSLTVEKISRKSVRLAFEFANIDSKKFTAMDGTEVFSDYHEKIEDTGLSSKDMPKSYHPDTTDKQSMRRFTSRLLYHTDILNKYLDKIESTKAEIA